MIEELEQKLRTESDIEKAMELVINSLQKAYKDGKFYRASLFLRNFPVKEFDREVLLAIAVETYKYKKKLSGRGIFMGRLKRHLDEEWIENLK